ncbi:single-stranded DNA-binding protein [Jatrophihabitans endophyticus]|uniref:single-stranded DNA-binding protein n=1 Tax=Jatrophihabitans endophyticus TaxID=1206085 RepID=UPI0019DE61D2|nr:single-stranded DNA-binding protein [Jatrophihabitans endophyticus]MBE7187609.1 single-stranded DNA-binding protein [Jatrophihabitans endophyticus]
MTITGNLVDAPVLRRTKAGHPVANFRVAQTPRRFDREKNAWVDGDTLFVTCTAWRGLAENAHQSLGKGQPVIVHGRYCQREYLSGETLRTAYELEAMAIGPDLNRGVTTFEKVSRPAVGMTVEVDDEGIPADRTHEYLDLEQSVGDAPVAEVDLQTGEVRELVTAS